MAMVKITYYNTFLFYNMIHLHCEMVAGLSSNTNTAPCENTSFTFRYAANLTEAKVFGIRKSRASGLGLGCVYVIMFSAYGLVFWFGAKMVQDGDLTVGRLITVQ